MEFPHKGPVMWIFDVFPDEARENNHAVAGGLRRHDAMWRHGNCSLGKHILRPQQQWSAYCTAQYQIRRLALMKIIVY